ncbi:phage terminase small subunit P27 family [Clostridium botulinum]|uniref:Phage terminase, small subunit, P27 family n=1 Tax=Clostridium botulinum (strain Eklund 17B / Type B) TaxID=935198 RepID=B2TMF4_CLOBB|nr:phage terminase small subunit P27 family [Clostridium sp. M14]ACD23631.1 phage terminase, small subunit, P27 family [Clostridium botulinum B str. Eklund 17B (NRP)]MBY6976807.1 phage terminase small subunit P27 family [Clostridium botulinum]MBY7002300.1 phage terminase small subunit P27 family [Clostridium botulinum]MBZ9690705.1 phage terminase small subunit P27 family [Clostridium sp. M14]MCR1274097.1 phage terminase small subunit P27 family [Clostridium botulinum]
MARPCKVIDSQSRHNTKEEVEERKAAEEKIKVLADKIEKPPIYLSKGQKKIYKFIIDELKATGILTNLDVYILSTCSIAVDRLETIEKIINKNISALTNKDLMSAKDKYTKDLYRCCNELSLSPQSRAKLGNLALLNKEKEDDPILKVLKGES